MKFFDENLTLSGDWIQLAQNILKQYPKVMVLGKTDTGKTSFIRAIGYYLIKRNKTIGIIDADIGQSTIGLPGTIGMQILEYQDLQRSFAPEEEIFFVGAISPVKCIEKFIEGIDRLFQICQHKQAEIILIDTTGLVIGQLGKYLKCMLINKVQPSCLVALQFGSELEPILKEFEDSSLIDIYRFKPCSEIKSKSWRERKNRRQGKFQEYFKNLKLSDFNLFEIPLIGSCYNEKNILSEDKVLLFNQKYFLDVLSVEIQDNKAVLIVENPQGLLKSDLFSEIKECLKVERIVIIPQTWFDNILVSFKNKQGLSDGLGIVYNINFKQKKLRAYIRKDTKLNSIEQIELGQIKVKPGGIELPYLEPEAID